MPLLGRGAVPARRLCIILRDASASVIHEPEVVLRYSVPLLGGAVPAHHPCVIRRRALAFFGHDPEIVLRGGVPLFGGGVASNVRSDLGAGRERDERHGGEQEIC